MLKNAIKWPGKLFKYSSINIICSMHYKHIYPYIPYIMKIEIDLTYWENVTFQGNELDLWEKPTQNPNIN